MKNLRHWLLLLVLTAQPATAFEFNHATHPYDFSQTVEIFIVDQQRSKFFAMRDPFEMTMTTMPSRFYVALMGALVRGHHNGEGVIPQEGAAAGVDYVLLFKSLNSAHVLFVGKHWIQDGNKKILLTPEEVTTIYELLLRRAETVEPMDLKQWEPFFKEINELQAANDSFPRLTSDDELKSMMDARKSIEERLPESHDDMKTLPYYNKALENQRFLEEYEKAKKPGEPESLESEQAKLGYDQPNNEPPIAREPEKHSEPEKGQSGSPAPKEVPVVDKQENIPGVHWLVVGLLAGVAYLLFVGFRRRSSKA